MIAEAAGADVRLEAGVTAVHPYRVEFDDKTTISGAHRGVGRSAAVAHGWRTRRGRARRRRPHRRGLPGIYAVGDVIIHLHTVDRGPYGSERLRLMNTPLGLAAPISGVGDWPTMASGLRMNRWPQQDGL